MSDAEFNSMFDSKGMVIPSVVAGIFLDGDVAMCDADQTMLTPKGKLIPLIAAQRIMENPDYEFVTMIDNNEMLFYDHGVYRKYGKSYIKDIIQKMAPRSATNMYIVNEIIGHIRRSTYTDRKNNRRSRDTWLKDWMQTDSPYRCCKKQSLQHSTEIDK